MSENTNPVPGGLLPLGKANGNTNPGIVTPVREQVSLDSKVDEWLEKNPANTEFKAEAPKVEEPVAEVKAEVEKVETPPTAEPTTEVSAEAPIVPQAKTEAAPVVAPTTSEPVVEVKPAAPTTPVVEPARLDLNAKYVLAEGQQPWTGEQIMARLREFPPVEAKAKEADEWSGIFGMTSAQAKETWTPILASIRQSPDTIPLIDQILADPGKSAYLRDCAAYYDSPEAQTIRSQAAPTANAPATTSIHPEVQKRLEQLEADNKRLAQAEESRKQIAANERVAREMNVALEQYPFLRNRQELVQDLLMTASALNAGDDSETSKGILDALALKKPLYDAMLIASREPLPVEARPEVPPLLGTNGAAPQATRPTVVRPQKFENLDDAVEQWINNPPAAFR